MQEDSSFADDILQRIEILVVDAVGAVSVTAKATLTTRAMKQWRVGREFNRRILESFTEIGISASG